ncbi:hypothetical protein GTQ43_18530 [Nostoc sp. KVJ3]|nr:hypothetical protein [Nostoc sp. KVJ3]
MRSPARKQTSTHIAVLHQTNKPSHSLNFPLRKNVNEEMSQQLPRETIVFRFDITQQMSDAYGGKLRKIKSADKRT